MFAVLTGDIVASSALSASELDDTLAAVEAVARGLGEWPGVSVCGYARRAGDAWQIAFDAPRFALRAALLVQAHVKRLDKSRATRITVAVGAGEMPDGNPNNAHGEAFVASGRHLDQLSSAVSFGDARSGAEEAVAILAGEIASGWTKAQARAMALQLSPDAGPRIETAKALRISRQAVDQALWSGGFLALEAALERLEAV